jgi:hypothetical protein
MPVFIRMRLAAIRLARALRRSMLTQRKLWEIDADSEGRPCLSAGPFRVVIAPRTVRLLDALHLYCGGTEIWLPAVWRLRLRNAARLVILENALELLAASDLERQRRRPRAVRRTHRRIQPA